jgi:hypothetical protein
LPAAFVDLRDGHVSGGAALADPPLLNAACEADVRALVRSGGLRDPRMPRRLREQRLARAWPLAALTETDLGQFDGRDRRRVAVVVTTDGRRVNVPIDGSGLVDVSLPGLLRSLLLGLDSLLGLITGSRRENGGTRRNGR